jgi:hypothetical protein
MIVSSEMKDTLSPATERTYKACLRKVEDYDLDSAEGVLKMLEEQHPNPNSRRVYLSALLWKHKSGRDFDLYKEAFEKVKKMANQQAKKQELPEGRKEKFVPWDELVRLYNEKKASVPVVVSCYILNPPVRADYAGMEYVKRMPKTIEGNYCLLRRKNPVFIFSQYKTSEAYGLQEVPISKELAVLLNAHHASGAKVVYDGNRNALSHYIRNCLKELTGKEVGIGLLRHAFITKFYESNPSILEKEKVANMMLHSYTTGEMYREVDSE